MIRYLIAVSAVVVASSTFACPAAPFEALGNDEQVVAEIQGDRILDAGWNQYSTGEDEEYTVTRYAKTGLRESLWRYEAKDPNQQPGIIWAVWLEAGMYEGFVNFYDIQTNVRALGHGPAVLTKDRETGHYKVECR